MSQWIKTDHDWDLPWAWLTVSNREAQRYGLSLPSLMETPDLDVVEKVVCDLIEEVRPELAGGALVAVRYATPALVWEFGLVHRSLPRVPAFRQAPRGRLIPEPGMIDELEMARRGEEWWK